MPCELCRKGGQRIENAATTSPFFTNRHSGRCAINRERRLPQSFTLAVTQLHSLLPTWPWHLNLNRVQRWEAPRGALLPADQTCIPARPLKVIHRIHPEIDAHTPPLHSQAIRQFLCNAQGVALTSTVRNTSISPTNFVHDMSGWPNRS
jgi:hypothetical protein